LVNRVALVAPTDDNNVGLLSDEICTAANSCIGDS
jgi:hypothetical protein